MFKLDIINIVLVGVALANFGYAFVAFWRNRTERINSRFFIFVLCIEFWIISMILYRGVLAREQTIFWSRILYVSATMIPIFFLRLAAAFPDSETILTKKRMSVLWVFSLLIAGVALVPGLLIRDVVAVTGSEKVIIFNKYLETLFAAYIISYFSLVYYTLFKRYFKAEGALKMQLKYLIGGILVSTIIAVNTNLIFPYFGYFALNWFGQATVVIMIAAIFYAIIKHSLFNIKIISAEFFSFIVLVMLVVDLYFYRSAQELVFKLVVFIAISIFSLLLVKAVVKEVEDKDRIALLADSLEAANKELLELDKVKSDFVSIASHQLRTPLSIMKGYLSLIREGSYGKLLRDQHTIVDRIYKSNEGLIRLVNDLLDVSHIERKKMAFFFKKSDIEKMVSEVVDGFQMIAKEKKLVLSYEKFGTDFVAVCDIDKIRQVVENLIDNAVKYTPKGSIRVTVSNVGNNNIVIAVTDTGIGVSDSTKKDIFRIFVRGKGVSHLQTDGTGLGLYVAKSIVEEHGGTIAVESRGEDRGSVFAVSLPIEGRPEKKQPEEFTYKTK